MSRRHTMRDYFRPIIAGAIAEGRAAGLDGRKLLKHIRGYIPMDAEATSSGYKVWLDEIRLQLGKRRPLGERARKPDAAGQRTLF